LRMGNLVDENLREMSHNIESSHWKSGIRHATQTLGIARKAGGIGTHFSEITSLLSMSCMESLALP